MASGAPVARIALLSICAAAALGCRDRPASAPADRTSRDAGMAARWMADTTLRPPAGVRVKVEVLNATRRQGLARRATQYLRELGYDVVASGTSRVTQDNTLVLDRSGHPDWARRLGAAMRSRVTARPDTSRYLDATVVLGADWTPPPLPLDP